MMIRHRARTAGVSVLAAIVILFSLTGCQLSTDSNISALAPVIAAAAGDTSASTSSTAATAPAATASITVGDFSTAVRDVAQKVKPAVVQITNQQVQFDRFDQPYDVPAGVGSGVIYDDQGHILTNNHVIEGAEQLLVSLPDGRSFSAKLVGADSQTDLAVVQISGTDLPVAQLGDSGQLQVGDWVVAIGNALALPGGPTVTAGVVSALNRTVQEPGDGQSQGPFLFDVIQTSAPINPGNSGGPLVNLAGQVVGINTMVAGQTDSGVPAQGIGFAISLASAKPIADQLVATGHVVHPYLGISYVPLNPALASRLGVDSKTSGVAVAEVASGSPAAKAGLKSRDVITAIDGNKLENESGLQQMLSQHQPGDTVTLTILRGAQTTDIQVTLGERPSEVSAAGSNGLANG